MTSLKITRPHRTRLLQVWRSAGWPCRDGLEIDLLAAGLLSLQCSAQGHEVLKLTASGLQELAQARQRGLRAASAHDRLAHRFAQHLLAAGRIVWHELSLRAAVQADAQLPAASAAPAPAAPPAVAGPTLWADEACDLPAARAAAQVWRMARPDLFSVRNTSVPAYLQPMVHEVKASRADLLSDLRHAAKRQAYQWLCEECYYVFPAGVATLEEIPEQFGVWVVHGSVDDGRFELLRPARHATCQLPFAVWMALCKATPLRPEQEAAQAPLGADGTDGTDGTGVMGAADDAASASAGSTG